MKTSLKLHRLQRGMKQSDLADLVNVRRETIGRLEQGQYCPSLRLAMDLARVFGTTVEDLLSFDDEYKAHHPYLYGAYLEHHLQSKDNKDSNPFLSR